MEPEHVVPTHLHVYIYIYATLYDCSCITYDIIGFTIDIPSVYIDIFYRYALLFTSIYVSMSDIVRLSYYRWIWRVSSLPKSWNPGKASTTLSTGGPGATLTNGSASKKLNLPGFRCLEARIFRRMPSPEQSLMLRSFRRRVQICPFLAAKQIAAPSTPIDMAFVTSIASIVLEGNYPVH